MIKLFFLISSFLGIACTFSQENLKPLFQEDKHFIYYRTLMISSAVSRIKDRIEFFFPEDDKGKELKREIIMEIETIRYNLGECSYLLSD